MKINIAIVTSTFVLSALLLGNSHVVLACTPINRTPQESLSSADLVFQGKVISTATSSQIFVDGGTSVPTKVSTMEFQVEKFWKGSPAARVIVKSTAAEGYTCPIYIPKAVGTAYLVYAKKDVNSNNYIVGYSEIKEVSSASFDLTFLGGPKTPNVEVKTNVSIPVTPVKTRPTSNVTTKTVEKPATSVNANIDAQSNIDTTQSNFKVEIKQNFIQRMLSWFRNLIK